MNSEPPLLETTESTDFSSQLPAVTSSLTDTLGPIMWFSLALTVVFIVFYILSMLRRRKLENALFDIQKNLRELNERDKARLAPRPHPTMNPEKETIIARASEPTERP